MTHDEIIVKLAATISSIEIQGDNIHIVPASPTDMNTLSYRLKKIGPFNVTKKTAMYMDINCPDTDIVNRRTISNIMTQKKRLDAYETLIISGGVNPTTAEANYFRQIAHREYVKQVSKKINQKTSHTR